MGDIRDRESVFIGNLRNYEGGWTISWWEKVTTTRRESFPWWQFWKKPVDMTMCAWEHRCRTISHEFGAWLLESPIRVTEFVTQVSQGDRIWGCQVEAISKQKPYIYTEALQP